MQLEDQIVKHVIDGFHIPPKPDVLEKVQNLAKKPYVNPAKVGAIVSTDVGMSAAILKTLNSPFYGMARSITDVTQATIMLGVSSVVNLIAANEIKQAFHDRCCISLERFWDSASEIASVMVYIGKQVKPTIPFEDLYATGLFHDCGIPAMATKFPNYVDTLVKGNSNDGARIIELEDARYATNHAIVGYYIASSWGLPKDLCNVILQHHDIRALDYKVSSKFLWMYCCLKTACNIVENVRRFQNTQDWFYVKDPVLSSMGLTELDYQDFEEDIMEKFR